MSKKVCVVSGSRSEYSLLYPLLIEISQNDFLALQLVVTAMHLSKDFGSTISEIESDGFQIDEKIDSLTDLGEGLDISMAVSAANTLLKVSHAFERLKPDLVLLLGDRFETHAAASSALLLNIPIAHIHGGELSEGAIDEQLRHSITKMSHIHFCSIEEGLSKWEKTQKMYLITVLLGLITY